MDITILYQGGSGGFALYYYLLLSGKYTNGNGQNLINQQFNSSLQVNPGLWKQKEFWPNNLELKRSGKSPRVFLICNPCWNQEMTQQNLMISRNTYKILLYTDLKLQLRMAYEKRAYWFTDVSKEQFGAPDNEQHYIRKIIADSDNGFDPMLAKVRSVFNTTVELRLENFIKTGQVPGIDQPNQYQLNFLKYWKELQPKKSVRLLDR